MAEDVRYNGWTNRETWCASSWITNDPGMEAEALTYADASELKAWMEELSGELEEAGPNLNAKVLAMLLDIGSLWRVNWQEVYNSLH